MPSPPLFSPSDGGPSSSNHRDRATTPSNDDIDMDAETSALIAKIYLEDLEEVFRSRKGKGKARHTLFPSSSADPFKFNGKHAAEAQSRYFQQLIILAQDDRLSKSMSTAVPDIDRNYLDAFIVSEAAAVADRRAAEMLARGETLPKPTEFQARLECPEFVMHPAREPPSVQMHMDVSSGKMKQSEDFDVTFDGASRHRMVTPEPYVKTFKPVTWHSELLYYRHDLHTSSSSLDGSGHLTESTNGRAPTPPPKTAVFVEPADAAGPSFTHNKLVECIICTDQFRSSNTLHTPCDHYYCRDCISSYITYFIRDESLFPLHCCQVPIPVPDIDSFISNPFKRTTFHQKHAEFSVPSKVRVYCIVPTCSRFLGSGVEGVNVTDNVNGLPCIDCGATTCPQCKQAAHGHEDCAVHASIMVELKALAHKEGWQSCPGCETLVELEFGCYHVTCRCRTQFCYLCAALWKTCECPQWDEARLLATTPQLEWQRRVENDIDQVQVGVPAVRDSAPEPVSAPHIQVVERAQTLPSEYRCERHNWRYRMARGRCRECRRKYRVYVSVMVCQGCSLQVCESCGRNHL